MLVTIYSSRLHIHIGNFESNPHWTNWTRRWAGKERYKKSQAVWILLSSCSRSRPKHTLAPSYYLAKNRLWPAGPTCSSLLLFAFFSAPRASRVHCQHLRRTLFHHCFQALVKNSCFFFFLWLQWRTRSTVVRMVHWAYAWWYLNFLFILEVSLHLKCFFLVGSFIALSDDGAWALLRPLRCYLFLGKTLVWNCCDFATVVVYVARHSLLRRNSFI